MQRSVTIGFLCFSAFFFSCGGGVGCLGVGVGLGVGDGAVKLHGYGKISERIRVKRNCADFVVCCFGC